MTRRWGWLGMLLLAACADPPSPPVSCVPAALGLHPTRSGLDWLSSAVTDANALLAAEGKDRLHLMTPEPSAPADPRSIPVWPVAGGALTPLQTAFVPPGCRAVFVQTPALAQRVQQWNGDPDSGLSIDPADVAIWILLHEVGHIRDASTGAFEPAPAVRGQHFSDTPQKRRELSADAHAARWIRNANAQQPTATFMAGMRAQMALSQLSWNLQRDRQLGHVAGSVLATPSVFGDVGDTHPNLELRILITRVLLDDTDTARELLEEFVATRQRAANPSPRVLYDVRSP